MTDSRILAELLDRMGDLLHDVGGIKERLNHGQKNFETMRQEHTVLREMLAPVVRRSPPGAEHVEAAKETTKKFDAMEPQFADMKTVTARFMTVAMVQGSVVGAALWGLTLIWPVVWGYIKSHVSINLGG
jgi:regulator of replication initiation timing